MQNWELQSERRYEMKTDIKHQKREVKQNRWLVTIFPSKTSLATSDCKLAMITKSKPLDRPFTLRELNDYQEVAELERPDGSGSGIAACLGGSGKEMVRSD